MFAQEKIEALYGKPLMALSNEQLIEGIQKVDFENENKILGKVLIIKSLVNYTEKYFEHLEGRLSGLKGFHSEVMMRKIVLRDEIDKIRKILVTGKSLLDAK